MARAIFDKANQRMRFFQRVEDGLCYIDISSLVPRSDIIDRPGPAFLKGQQNCPAMIVNINPITYIKTVAIDGNWLVAQRVREHQRQKFLGKLSRPIVIATTRDHCVESERVVCRAQPMLSGGL